MTSRGIWIGLGSNLGDSLELVRLALKQLDRSPGIRVIRASEAYRTAAVDVVDQPDFINGVAELEVQLPAHDLLEYLLTIEQQMGRKRTGPLPEARCIDLDLLLYGKQVVNTRDLVLPHPRMHLRAFVLCPLSDLCPGLMIPGRGNVLRCLNALELQLCQRLIGEKLWAGQ